MVALEKHTSASLKEKRSKVAHNKEEDLPTAEEVQSAKAGFSALQTAVKNFPLYPQDHSISIQLIGSTLDTINEHFKHYPTLKLTLEKDSFTYRGEKVATSHQGDLIGPPLRRDGIEWLAFEQGLLSHEISFLVEILHRYRVLASEPDGDLVTCLWKEDLAHIKYKASEILLESTPEFDFGLFKPRAGAKKKGMPGSGGTGSGTGGGPGQGPTGSGGTGAVPGGHEGPGGPEESGEAGGAGAGPSLFQLVGSPKEKGLLALSDDEKRTLQRMVVEEESWDNTYDVIDVLLIILHEQDEEDDFASFMKIAQAEFVDCLERCSFRYAHLLLKRLRDEQETFKFRGAKEKIDDFFTKIASFEVLEVLAESLDEPEAVEEEELLYLGKTLTMLPSEAVAALVQLLSEIPENDCQPTLLATIAQLSTINISPLEDALQESDDLTVLRVIPCLADIQHTKVPDLLLSLFRGRSAGVRRKTLEQVLVRDDMDATMVFHLIEDPMPEIRRMLLHHISRHRNKEIEKKLLEFLRSTEFGHKEKDHLLECFMALGRCGSHASLPFLEECLQKNALMELITWSGYQQKRAAAEALSLLGMSRADTILQKYSKSVFPHVRRAAKSAGSR